MMYGQSKIWNGTEFVSMSYEIVELLTEINKRGTTILMVTHEHDLVKHFGKRVIEINSGKIISDSESPEV